MVFFSAISELIAGIGVFLIGCDMMSKNIGSIGSNKLKKIFTKNAGNKFFGVGVGTVGTAIIQSSGAMTVMIIGFVNAGIISSVQAATIIYGANIGTTITAHIAALGISGGVTSASTILSASAGIGVFIVLIAKKDIVRSFGETLAGFGSLFVGLSLISGSMAHFSTLGSVKQYISGIDNAIILVLIGTLLTAVTQSSSVMTSIVITMAIAHLITIDQGIYLIIGANIGACFVTFIAGLAGGKNARRAALLYFFFNAGGAVFFLLTAAVISLVSRGNTTLGTLAAEVFPHMPQITLAFFHTLFNVITMLLFLPFTEKITGLIEYILPDASQGERTKTVPKAY